LPLHDGLLVKLSAAKSVEENMGKCSRRVAGVELPVSAKYFHEKRS